MKRVLGLVLALMVGGHCGAQKAKLPPEPDIRWQRVYGGSATDQARVIVPLPGRSLLLVGSTRSNDGKLDWREGLDFDMWLAKLSYTGELLWQHSLGGRYHDEGKAAHALPDGSYVVGGFTASPELTHGERDIFAVRIDGLGRVRWQKAYGGSGNEDLHAMIPLSDGGFLLVGETGSADGDVKRNQGGIDAWLVRIDADGRIKWQRTYGGPGNERAVDALVNSDGSFIILASSDAQGGDISQHWGGTDYWLFAVSADGNPSWRRYYGGRDNDEPHGIVRDQQNNMYLVGTSFSQDGYLAGSGHRGQGDVWVLALRNDGSKIWSKCYGGLGQDGASQMILTQDRNLMVAATSRSRDGVRTGFKGVFDGWLLKISPRDGSLVWQKSAGGFQNDDLFAVREVPGVGYFFAGMSNSVDGDLQDMGAAGGADLWALLATDPVPPGKKPVPIPEAPTMLTGYVTDAKTRQLLAAEITLLDQIGRKPIRSIKVDTTAAQYSVLLTRQTGIALACVAPGYMLYSQPIKLGPDQVGNQVRLDIELQPIAKDSTINLYDIYFDEGKSDLRGESDMIMNLLLLFLKQNPRIRIQIAGHTDAVGNNQTKKQLSQSRALAIKSWLQTRGINPQRLENIGFGAERPLVPEVDEFARALNRRVEIKILSTH